MRNPIKSNLTDMTPDEWAHYQVNWMGRNIVQVEEHQLYDDVVELLARLVAPGYRATCPCLRGVLSRSERNRVCEGCVDCSKCPQFINDMELQVRESIKPLLVETIGVGEEDIEILVYGKG